MALEDFLVPRRLIAAINDPNLIKPKQFLLNNFFGAPDQSEEEVIDIYRAVGDNGLAAFRSEKMASNVVGNIGQEFIGTFRYPRISEKKSLEVSDLKKFKTFANLYNRMSAETRKEKEGRIIQKYLTQLRERIERRKEWMAAKLLTTGIITYAIDNVAIKIDLRIDSKFFPVLSGTSKWGGADANIAQNITEWTGRINTATGGYGGRIILGADVVPVFSNDEKVRKDVSTINVQAGRIILDGTQRPGTETVGTYNGFTFEHYSETFKDDDGIVKPYFPSNGVLIMGSTFVGHQLHGPNDLLGDYTDAPIYVDEWEEKDPDVRWFRAQSRPLPLPEQEGSWVFATVMDPVS